jgi:hypothetical protein
MIAAEFSKKEERSSEIQSLRANLATLESLLDRFVFSMREIREDVHFISTRPENSELSRRDLLMRATHSILECARRNHH